MRAIKSVVRATAIAAAMVAGASQAQAAAPSYIFIDLGTVDGSAGSNSIGVAINNAGKVVGTSSVDGGWTLTHYSSELDSTKLDTYSNGVRWDNNGALPSLADVKHSYVTGLNNADQSVGAFTAAESFDAPRFYNAVRWTGKQAVILESQSGDSIAYSVNDLGTVVGHVGLGTTDATGNLQYSAMLWNVSATTGAVTSKILATGAFTEAYSINNAGQVVGTKQRQATMWNPDNTVVNLSQLCGSNNGQAWAINAAGTAVGWNNFNWEGHPVMWSGGKCIDLAAANTFLEGWRSAVYAINNSGVMVGEGGTLAFPSDTYGTRAIMWSPAGVAVDLNSFLSNDVANKRIVLRQALGINDNGWITGYASVGDNPNDVSNSARHAFLLIPSNTSVAGKTAL
ncbi:DUF3466 family protein [Duganella vulcania]|uniref:DUF3466 family protein n=1 Tax=Duganella vulcania TaxID=2692166 RepID=A0A845GG92_9BURK|nr:DUF3466 family protein [Duganella vulcania]MYM92422.1 DUF3466 family protein [Duganella vulcania]